MVTVDQDANGQPLFEVRDLLRCNASRRHWRDALVVVNLGKNSAARVTHVMLAHLQIHAGSLEMFHMKPGVPMRELVLAYDGCHDSRTVTGPCVPVPTRTGWRASRPCVCSDRAAPIINCRGAGSGVL